MERNLLRKGVTRRYWGTHWIEKIILSSQVLFLG